MLIQGAGVHQSSQHFQSCSTPGPYGPHDVSRSMYSAPSSSMFPAPPTCQFSVSDNISHHKSLPDTMQSQAGTVQKKRGNELCYRCGIEGHYAVTCMNAPNVDLVDKMVQERRRQRGSKGTGSGNYRW